MIDAHQHLWLIGHNDCEWPTPDLAAIHRDYAVADLEAVARPLGITGSVLVQSQPSDRDTDWMLEAANDAPFILGVIGWADLKAADAPKRIAHLARQPKRPRPPSERPAQRFPLPRHDRRASPHRQV